MYTLCQLKAWHSSVLTSSVGICSQPSPQLCASLWASWTTILQPMRMRFFICLLVSSFLLYSKKNTVQPQYEWSTTVTGVVQALKIFLDVLSMKTWHFFLLSPPDVAPSCYTDGMETLLPKEPARTICSQANPTKPVGLCGLEVCGLTVDSDIIVRLFYVFRKPWAEWTQKLLWPKSCLIR